MADTKADLQKKVVELEKINDALRADNARLALTMREAVTDGGRWREQFWLLIKVMQIYVKHVPDTSHGNALGQARMIASIDPETKDWSVFWSTPPPK